MTEDLQQKWNKRERVDNIANTIKDFAHQELGKILQDDYADIYELCLELCNDKPQAVVRFMMDAHWQMHDQKPIDLLRE